jgi:hypothetical protein
MNITEEILKGVVPDSLCYPKLTEMGQLEAQELVENFKSKLRKAAHEIISDLYTEIPDYIESDSWTNFRNTILADLCDYSNQREKHGRDFKRIRQSIYEENKEQINKDLNQDLLGEIESLRKQLEYERTYRA